jgi:HEAT repeat protein
MYSFLMKLCLIPLLFLTGASGALAQSDEVQVITENVSAATEKQLRSRDPLIRQRAAEEFAQTAAPGNRKLLEGYRLQEKNVRVRLALDWALYRIGKTEALYTVVRALDSKLMEQAVTYLTALDSPAPLYLFLERMNGNTQTKLIEVLGKIGDEDTLEKIKPHSESFDPQIAEAARMSTREIEQRLGQAPADNTTRPRQVGDVENIP